MFIKSIFISVLTIVFSLSFSLNSTALSAECYIAVDASNFSSYSEGNAYKKREIASVTKIMTAVIALENCEDLSDIVSIDDQAIGVEGSSIYLKKGEKLTVEDLVWAVLLNSANDAAVALAIHVSGSVEEFVKLMNLKATALCMEDTVYKTPHGLPAQGQYSTAHDQAILACYALSVDGFIQISGTYTHSIPYCGTQNGRTLVNHNKMLSTYEGCIGLKTGYTKNAGRCLVICAQRQGLVVVCVTLNDPNDWQDHKTLLDKGFKKLSCNTG